MLPIPPEPLHEGDVQVSGFAAHRYHCLGPLQPVSSVEGCAQAALVDVHDFGPVELWDGLVQSVEAEVRLQRV